MGGTDMEIVGGVEIEGAEVSVSPDWNIVLSSV